MEDAAELRRKAAQCRRLAKSMPQPETVAMLTALAAELELRAIACEAQQRLGAGSALVPSA